LHTRRLATMHFLLWTASHKSFFSTLRIHRMYSRLTKCPCCSCGSFSKCVTPICCCAWHKGHNILQAAIASRVVETNIEAFSRSQRSPCSCPTFVDSVARVPCRDGNHSCRYFTAREAEATRDHQPASSAAPAARPSRAVWRCGWL
jgi:hypothetical protein